jgi:hypothetical protein
MGGVIYWRGLMRRNVERKVGWKGRMRNVVLVLVRVISRASQGLNARNGSIPKEYIGLSMRYSETPP